MPKSLPIHPDKLDFLEWHDARQEGELQESLKETILMQTIHGPLATSKNLE